MRETVRTMEIESPSLNEAPFMSESSLIFRNKMGVLHCQMQSDDNDHNEQQR